MTADISSSHPTPWVSRQPITTPYLPPTPSFNRFLTLSLITCNFYDALSNSPSIPSSQWRKEDRNFQRRKRRVCKVSGRESDVFFDINLKLSQQSQPRRLLRPNLLQHHPHRAPRLHRALENRHSIPNTLPPTSNPPLRSMTCRRILLYLTSPWLFHPVTRCPSIQTTKNSVSTRPKPSVPDTTLS